MNLKASTSVGALLGSHGSIGACAMMARVERIEAVYKHDYTETIITIGLCLNSSTKKCHIRENTMRDAMTVATPGPHPFPI